MHASPRRLAVLAAVVALAVVVWGGYGEHWSWTGINGGTATLWDWLHLLLLPVVVGVLPIWLSRKTRMSPRSKSATWLGLGVFAVLVLLGYVVPWAWTGFSGNRLWDWLELIALPVALALTPIIDELREGWDRRDSLAALAGLAAFAVVVLGGYVLKWDWTGFRGNTVWNWLHLLLLPLLLPMVIVPALKPKAMAAVTIVETDDPSAQGQFAPAPGSTGDSEGRAESGAEPAAESPLTAS
jgi:hypothetical protein